MKHVLPDLPFAREALAPVISAETIDYHWGKHHRAYVNKLNELIPGTEFEKMSLEDIVLKSTGPIFNNAGQIWNHNFYWQSLSPQARAPRDELFEAIKKSFSSLDLFKEQFNKAAVGQFGSGWAWLVLKQDGKLAIETTSNAENPLRQGKMPLLTVDVWEHAYYIDYRNERPRYLESIAKLINWEFAEANFEKALKSVAA